MVITIATEANLKPGRIKMIFGDTHIYEDHIENAKKQILRKPFDPCLYNYKPNNIRRTDETVFVCTYPLKTSSSVIPMSGAMIANLVRVEGKNESSKE